MYKRYISKFIYLSLYLSKSGSGCGAAMWAVLHLDNGARLLVGVRRHVQQDLESPQDLHQQKDSAHGKPRSIVASLRPSLLPVCFPSSQESTPGFSPRQPRTNHSNSLTPSPMNGTSSIGSIDSLLLSSITPALSFQT